MAIRYRSARRKWERAEQHFKALKADFKRLEDFKGGSTALQFDHDPATDYVRGSRKYITSTVLLGNDVPQLSDWFPLIMGDAIHNYRAALDYLIWELVRRFGAKLNTKSARLVQFPMHNSAVEFGNLKHQRTPGVPDQPYRAFLKRYQPYRRGDGPLAVRWLRRLSDHDKHRELIPSVVAPRGVKVSAQRLTPGIKITRYNNLLAAPSTIYPRAPIGEITFSSPTQPGGEAVMKVQADFTLEPRLRYRRNPGALLTMISKTVTEIIDGIEALG